MDPLKPVGLEDPKTGKRPYAVVQLRQDDAAGTLYNIVGFQTHLKWGAQNEVIQMIPGLENAEIIRYGVMHRNTFINSPRVLKATYQFRKREDLFFAGQMTGVEGYVESAASGLIAGINAARIIQGSEPIEFPQKQQLEVWPTILQQQMQKFSTNECEFWIISGVSRKDKGKQERNLQHANRAFETIQNFVKVL